MCLLSYTEFSEDGDNVITYSGVLRERYDYCRGSSRKYDSNKSPNDIIFFKQRSAQPVKRISCA